MGAYPSQLQTLVHREAERRPTSMFRCFLPRPRGPSRLAALSASSALKSSPAPSRPSAFSGGSATGGLGRREEELFSPAQPEQASQGSGEMGRYGWEPVILPRPSALAWHSQT